MIEKATLSDICPGLPYPDRCAGSLIQLVSLELCAALQLLPSQLFSTPSVGLILLEYTHWSVHTGCETSSLLFLIHKQHSHLNAIHRSRTTNSPNTLSPIRWANKFKLETANPRSDISIRSAIAGLPYICPTHASGCASLFLGNCKYLHKQNIALEIECCGFKNKLSWVR